AVVIHVAADGLGRVRRSKKLQESTAGGGGAVSSATLADLRYSRQWCRPVVVMRCTRRRRQWHYSLPEEDVTYIPEPLRTAGEGAAPRCCHLACNTDPFQDHVTYYKTAVARDMPRECLSRNRPFYA